MAENQKIDNSASWYVSRAFVCQANAQGRQQEFQHWRAAIEPSGPVSGIELGAAISSRILNGGNRLISFGQPAGERPLSRCAVH
jgi:hypothetical protein